jgi:chaperonin cofactor prefoldin
MTYPEDVARVRSGKEDVIHFLNTRIKALETRVEYLEIQNQWIEQEFNINNLNK